MYVKITTTRVNKKSYRYVKIAHAYWNGNGSEEKIIATLGTVPEVIKSRDTIIRGLLALSTDSPTRLSRQNLCYRRAGPANRGLTFKHHTNKRPDIAGDRQGSGRSPRMKKNRKNRSKT